MSGTLVIVLLVVAAAVAALVRIARRRDGSAPAPLPPREPNDGPSSFEDARAAAEGPAPIGLRDDEITPALVFATARPLDALTPGTSPPLPERQLIRRRVRFDGDPVPFLVWMPDESRTELDVGDASEELPRPRAPVGMIGPTPELQRVTARFTDATGSVTEGDTWSLPREALLDPSASPDLVPFIETAADVEMAAPLALRAEHHVAISNFTPAAFASLLELLDAEPDPRPARVGSHPGIPISVYSVEPAVVRAVAGWSDEELAAMAARLEAPSPIDTVEARRWALERLRALTRAARADDLSVYVYFDQQILG